LKIKENFWQQFAIEANGKFSEGEYGRSDKAELIKDGWSIFFDHYLLTENGNNASQMFTRILIPFISNNNFKFEIYRTELFDTVLKLFGVQDITTGYEDFDKEFIVKSNNEHKIKSLLRDPEVRKSIQLLKKVNIQISVQHGIWEERLPKNEYELCIYIEEQISETEKLKNLGNLLHQIIGKLFEINPHIKPKETS
jgi:hypothetical protein